MKKIITIISPCFNEQDNIENCYKIIKEMFKIKLKKYTLEYIFIDNASTDNSKHILEKMALKDKNVKLIFNARNVGPLRSVYHALKSSSGHATLVMMAVDLQDPPELIVDFVKYWEKGFKVVQGVRKYRDEGFIFHSLRRIFYRMVKKLSNIDIPVDVGEFQLIDRIVSKALISFDDHYPYIRGMIANCGFKPYSVPYTLRSRKRGFSKNRLFTLIDIALNGLLTFTTAPVRFLTFVGVFLSFSSLFYALINLILLSFDSDLSLQPGIATIIVAIFFFFGIQFMFLGILGEYILSIHGQVRFKSIVVEEKRVNFGK